MPPERVSGKKQALSLVIHHVCFDSSATVAVCASYLEGFFKARCAEWLYSVERDLLGGPDARWHLQCYFKFKPGRSRTEAEISEALRAALLPYKHKCLARLVLDGNPYEYVAPGFKYSVPFSEEALKAYVMKALSDPSQGDATKFKCSDSLRDEVEDILHPPPPPAKMDLIIPWQRDVRDGLLEWMANSNPLALILILPDRSVGKTAFLRYLVQEHGFMSFCGLDHNHVDRFYSAMSKEVRHKRSRKFLGIAIDTLARDATSTKFWTAMNGVTENLINQKCPGNMHGATTEVFSVNPHILVVCNGMECAEMFDPSKYDVVRPVITAADEEAAKAANAAKFSPFRPRT